MDTLLILRDTITTNVVKVVDTIQPCVKETETDWKDVAIVTTICFALVVMISIISNVFKKWQETKYDYLKNNEEFKYNQEIVKTIANRSANTKQTEKSIQDRFLAFCEDRKDIREDKDFVEYCVKKYKSLMDEKLGIKESYKK